jgi:HlyD family secretion protein
LAQSAPLGRTPPYLAGGGFRLSPIEGVTLIAVLVIAAFIGYEVYSRSSGSNATPAKPPTYVPAVRTTLTSNVTATGTIQSSQQVSLTFDVGQGGGKIQTFFVKLGDQVTAGQPLAKLDDTDLLQAVRSADASLASAQARLNAAVQGPTGSDVASAQQSLVSANSQVVTAQKNLDDLRSKPLAADVASAQQSIFTAQNALQTANDGVSKARTDVFTAQNDVLSATLKANTACTATSSSSSSTGTGSGTGSGGTGAGGTGSGSGTGGSTGGSSSSTSSAALLQSCFDARSALAKSQLALTNAQTSLNNGNLQRQIQNAQAGLDAANQKYQETIQGPKPGDLSAAQASLDSAQASVITAQARYDELFQPAKPDVVLPLQASVEQARAQSETAKKALSAATITAPFDGQISQVNGDIGTQVASNTVVFILLNPRILRIDANVDQAYVSDLKAGQTANVTFDALPGRSYQANVTAIGLTPTVQQGVVNYVVTLGIDTTRIPPNTAIPTPGMTASISIQTNRTENALAVPVRAIRRIGRNQTLTVKTANGSEQRNVTTGATNGTLIQITSGLQDNEEVLVNAPAAASATPQRPGGVAIFP